MQFFPSLKQNSSKCIVPSNQPLENRGSHLTGTINMLRYNTKDYDCKTHYSTQWQKAALQHLLFCPSSEI
jgi:hypothetical protein